MSLEDRHWYKEDFDRRMGRNKGKKEPEKPEQPKARESSDKAKEDKRGSTKWKNNHKPEPERVRTGKTEKTEKREYEKSWQIPPADAVLAAKYALAMRARTRKTFWSGFVLGALIAGGAAVAIMRLL